MCKKNVMRPACHQWELPHQKLALCLCRAIAGVVPEAHAQEDNGRQAHLVHYLFDFLRGPSQHDRPASRPSPAPVLSRDGFQSCSKGGVSGEQQRLRLRSLPRGARPLLLRSDCLPCTVSPFPPACLAADISLRLIDFLCVWPDESASFSAAAVSDLLQHSPRRAACQYIQPLACRRPCRPTFSGVPRKVASACWHGPR
jgi:hypothetical protein